jgi:hypothetical protein
MAANIPPSVLKNSLGLKPTANKAQLPNPRSFGYRSSGQVASTFISQNAPTEQDIYLSTVRSTYPTAQLSEAFGSESLSFIQSKFSVSPSNLLVAESICSDDVDAPVFKSNIGQFPDSMTAALTPFLAGGIGGYPHTGVTGLAAWISHVTTPGSLFLFSAPHIGVTYEGLVGSIKRRGQGGRISSTCGAVNAAIASVVGGWTPALSAASPIFSPTSVYYDYQQNTLTNILYNNRVSVLAADPVNRMQVATEIIRVASKDWINTNLPTSYAAVSGGSVGTPDVYVATGTFINTDDGYKSFMQVNSFQKYSYTNGWQDYSSDYLTYLNS